MTQEPGDGRPEGAAPDDRGLLTDALSGLCDATQDAIWIRDLQGRVIFRNASATARTLPPAPDGLAALASSENAEPFARMQAAETRAAETGVRETVTCQWVRKDGTPAYYEVRFIPLRDSGGAIVAVAARALDMAVGRSEASLLEAIGDATSDAMFAKDLDLRFTYVNASFLTRIHRSKAAVLGKTLAEVWPGAPAEFEASERLLLETGEPEEVRWTGATPSGERTLRSRRFPIRAADGAVVGLASFTTDITAEAALSRELTATTARLTEITELTPNILWTLDADGNGAMVNARWEEFTGLPRPVGQEWIEAVHPDQRADVFAGALAVAENREPWRAQFRLRHHTGRYRWVLANAVPRWGADGKLDGWVGSFTDCHDLVKAERKAQELQAQLSHVSRVNEMGQMASALAHELNQPLSAAASYVQGSARLLKAPDPDPVTAQGGLAMATEQILRAGDIIRRLRDFLARREPHRERESLGALLDETFAMAAVGVLSPGVAIRREVAPGAEAVEIDRVEIQQVLLNLIRNAADAMQGQEIRAIAVSAEPVDGGMVLISVHDTGPGLSPRAFGELFSPFVSSKADGMGIGLSICRTIIEGHGGQIWAEAPGDGGATLRFTVPAAPAR